MIFYSRRIGDQTVLPPDRHQFFARAGDRVSKWSIIGQHIIIILATNKSNNHSIENFTPPGIWHHRRHICRSSSSPRQRLLASRRETQSQVARSLGRPAVRWFSLTAANMLWYVPCLSTFFSACPHRSCRRKGLATVSPCECPPASFAIGIC